MRKINLGCGKEKKDGWINLDRDLKCEPNIVWDAGWGLPFDDNSVNEVYMKDFLEHIEDYVFLFNEIYRVCKGDTKIWIQVPYAFCEAAHDVDHKSYWTPRKFKQLADRFYDYYGMKGKFEVVELKTLKNNDEVTFIHCTYKVIK